MTLRALKPTNRLRPPSRPSSRLGLTLVSGLVWLLSAVSVSASIEFEDRGGERFSLDVRDEPITKVMDKLAERFDFDVDGYPTHWSDDPINFSATGDLERVLSSLLKDTSHVFEYHSFPDTNTTRIGGLKLLNDSKAGIFTPSRQANSQPNSPTNPDKIRGSERISGGVSTINRTGGNERNPVDDNQTDPESDALDASQPSNRVNTPVASVLSRSLEARARQSSGDLPASASNPTNPGSQTTASTNPGSSTPTGVSSAEMQALTQKALQDVRGLADALRKAEGN